MATKEQERKALAQIRKIVDGLGEDSYIGKAFEGCYEIAEENINNDFGCSMKQRWESAEDEADHFRQLAGQLRTELDGCEKKAEMYRKRSMTADEIAVVAALIELRYTELKNTVKSAAEDIVTYADRPRSNEFQSAVTIHRNTSGSLEKLQMIRGRFGEMRNA